MRARVRVRAHLQLLKLEERKFNHAPCICMLFHSKLVLNNIRPLYKLWCHRMWPCVSVSNSFISIYSSLPLKLLEFLIERTILYRFSFKNGSILLFISLTKNKFTLFLPSLLCTECRLSQDQWSLAYYKCRFHLTSTCLVQLTFRPFEK